MDTKKDWENQKQSASRQKMEAAVNELNDYFTQIYSINNILRFLYSFLSGEKADIVRASSVMLTCMWQLDYICEHSDELLDNILNYGVAE